MRSVITTDSLTKVYGRKMVVDQLSLSIPEGSIYGFLGPNGSGKSTTMKMLVGLVRPTSGEIVILGKPMTSNTRAQLLPMIGSLIEAPPGYGHLTGAENMRIIQQVLRLDRNAIASAVETVRLKDQMNKLVKNYSLGMKQRLGIAIALAREPQVLILDEPTNGLDPAGNEEVRDLLSSLASQGHTIMVSSHQLSEIERISTFLGIIDHGKLVFEGSRSELMRKSIPDVLITTGAPELACDVLREHHPTNEGDGIRLGGLNDPQLTTAINELVFSGVPITEVVRVTQSLEDVFISLTGRGGDL